MFFVDAIKNIYMVMKDAYPIFIASNFAVGSNGQMFMMQMYQDEKKLDQALSNKEYLLVRRNGKFKVSDKTFAINTTLNPNKTAQGFEMLGCTWELIHRKDGKVGFKREEEIWNIDNAMLARLPSIGNVIGSFPCSHYVAIPNENWKALLNAKIDYSVLNTRTGKKLEPAITLSIYENKLLATFASRGEKQELVLAPNCDNWIMQAVTLDFKALSICDPVAFGILEYKSRDSILVDFLIPGGKIIVSIASLDTQVKNEITSVSI